MQIFVKLRNEQGLQEWSIIELQGDLDIHENHTLAGKFVGDLFFNKDGVPTFVIGHHVLVGKAEKLQKPLAVLEKRPDESRKTTTETEYLVKAIVRRKICFRERPKPIVGSVVMK